MVFKEKGSRKDSDLLRTNQQRVLNRMLLSIIMLQHIVNEDDALYGYLLYKPTVSIYYFLPDILYHIWYVLCGIVKQLSSFDLFCICRCILVQKGHHYSGYYTALNSNALLILNTLTNKYTGTTRILNVIICFNVRH